jgi:hypothetical protein
MCVGTELLRHDASVPAVGKQCSEYVLFVGHGGVDYGGPAVAVDVVHIGPLVHQLPTAAGGKYRYHDLIRGNMQNKRHSPNILSMKI